MRTLLLGLFLVTCSTLPASAAEKWPDFDPSEFNQTASKIDPEAGAEVIRREVSMDQSDMPHEERVWLRVRIYNQKGVEDYAKIEIPYGSDREVRNIEARVIFPDGTIRELDRKEIYDREVLKVGKSRTRVKSFAPPGLQPGVVLDYRYSVLDDDPRWILWFTYQSGVPSRAVKFRFHPVQIGGLNVRFVFVRSPQPPEKTDGKGFYEFAMQDLPAWKEETFSPPTTNLQPSTLIFYSATANQPPALFWPSYAKKLATEGTRLAKKNAAITALVQKVVPPGTPPDTTLRLLFNHVRTQVSNRAQIPSHLRTKLPINRTPADTLKNGSGTASDLNDLFYALVTAAGLEAQLVRCGDREDMMFSPSFTEEFALSDDAVAVRLGDKWKFFQPGKAYIPFGALDWRNSDTNLLIGAKKDGAPILVPGAEPALSGRNREGKFKLDATGTLSGDVTVTYFGFAAVDLKEDLADLEPAKRVEYIRDQVKDIFKDADVTAIKLDGATDHDGPVTVTYTLKVPEYAERTGTRLFLQPAVFQKNAPPLFPDKERVNDIVFRYRHAHRDTIEIEPPAGFTLEAPSAPAKLEVPNLCNYDVSISVREKSGSLIYRRTFTLLRFDVPVTHYTALRGVFDLIRTRDQHALTLKRSAVPSPAAPTPPPAATEAPAAAPAEKTNAGASPVSSP